MTRVAILRDPAVPEGIGQFTVIQSAAPTLKLEVTPVDIRNASEIERALTEFSRTANGGLIVTSSALANVHRNLIVRLADKHRLPAVYSFRFFAVAGGLAAYGSDGNRSTPARSRLRRSHPKGPETGRSPRAGADQVRADDQSQDREGAGAHHFTFAAHPRRRGDRIGERCPLLALSGHRLVRCTCLLLTQSGHGDCTAQYLFIVQSGSRNLALGEIRAFCRRFSIVAVLVRHSKRCGPLRSLLHYISQNLGFD